MAGSAAGGIVRKMINRVLFPVKLHGAIEGNKSPRKWRVIKGPRLGQKSLI